MREPTTWLRLGEASRLLGVDPDTLRRWADRGQVEGFRTPGGHRRFRRATIEALLPEFRRRVRLDLAGAAPSWRARLDEDSLRWFRDHGMRLSRSLAAALDHPRAAERAPLLVEAAALAREYGAVAARDGLTLGETTEAFLFFRARFLAEIAGARRGALAPAAGIVARADRALDRVIVAFVAGHQAARAR